jgi:hypothetical protein
MGVTQSNPACSNQTHQNQYLKQDKSIGMHTHTKDSGRGIAGMGHGVFSRAYSQKKMSLIDARRQKCQILTERKCGLRPLTPKTPAQLKIEGYAK